MQMGYCVVSISALLLASLTRSQTVQDSWIAPAGPDFTSTLTVGELYTITWNPNLTDWFASYLSDGSAENVDLWITDYSLHVYAHLIASRENLESISSLSWRVDVPANEVLATNEWVFRWLPEGVDYFSTSEQISSPGFLLVALAYTSTSGFSPVATPAATSSSAFSTSTTAASTSPAATVSQASGASTSNAASTLASTPSSGGLSSGAKAGIAIAAIFGAAFSIGVGWFLARKIGNRPGPAQLPPNISPGYSDAKLGSYQQQPFMTASIPQAQPSELDSRSSGPVPAQELPGHRV
ncbi:hypothetical protein H2200_008817 [Cladophialophora chaetospira]|uniref:Uncharacterized protein n=1 Tax=Cladophialophora chaetospira TaxID=386627 RepID=A0AA38X4R1_9EURO|nr:hypothetical protein H2200_008817 [Cladophialophora chaetospira]